MPLCPFLFAKKKGTGAAHKGNLTFLSIHLRSHSPHSSRIGYPSVLHTHTYRQNIKENTLPVATFLSLESQTLHCSATPPRMQRLRISTGTKRQRQKRTQNARPPLRKCHSWNPQESCSLSTNGIPLGSSVMQTALQKFNQKFVYSCKIHLYKAE